MKEEEKKLKRWMGYSRKIYNAVVAWKKDNGRIPSQREIRDHIASKINGEWKYMEEDNFYWNCRDELVKEAIKDLKKALKDTLDSRKEGRFKEHVVKFKSAKKAYQSFPIREKNMTDAFKIQCMPAPYIREMRKEKRNWPNKEGRLERDGRINWNKKLNHWFVVWNYKKGGVGDESQIADQPIRSCVIDPGIRSFITLWSPSSGLCVDIGNKDASRLYRLLWNLDKLIQKTDNLKEKNQRWKKRNHKRAQEVIRQRIKNLVNELHRKTICWLTNNFDLILIPEFNVKSIVSKKIGRGFRKLNKKTVRQCFSMSHYLFRQRLISKCQEKGVLYAFPTEEYTSK